MKIDAVRAFKVTGPADVPAIEERSSQQIDIYPEYTGHERSSHRPGAPLSAIYIEIGTDEGVTGLFGPLFEETAFIVVKKLRPWLLGQNPFHRNGRLRTLYWSASGFRQEWRIYS